MEKLTMKHLILIFLISASHQIIAQTDSLVQKDTLITYFENGQLCAIVPKLNGKAHGKVKMWYASGQIRSKGVWENGKRIKNTDYSESGTRTTFEHYGKWKRKLILWHSNGQLQTKMKSKYRKSNSIGYDSTGIILHRKIEKKGAIPICSWPDGLAYYNRNDYENGECSCDWGKVIWKDSIWIDKKGRDLSSNYSYHYFTFYPNGESKVESRWNKELKKYNVREYDEKGNIINEYIR
ncbi:MAG: hypothetical protein ACJASQ_004291 [Crocinitomicaceae bacterium]|jgi:hypothetical protein